jgi:hypothetical protein
MKAQTLKLITSAATSTKLLISCINRNEVPWFSENQELDQEFHSSELPVGLVREILAVRKDLAACSDANQVPWGVAPHRLLGKLYFLEGDMAKAEEQFQLANMQGVLHSQTSFPPMTPVLVNLTPHPITVCGLLVEPAETPARCEQSWDNHEPAEVYGVLIPVKSPSFGAITGLPNPTQGLMFIVSLPVAQAAWGQGRTDVFTVGDPIRDKDGKIVGSGCLCPNPMKNPTTAAVTITQEFYSWLESKGYTDEFRASI